MKQLLGVGLGLLLGGCVSVNGNITTLVNSPAKGTATKTPVKQPTKQTPPKPRVVVKTSPPKVITKVVPGKKFVMPDLGHRPELEDIRGTNVNSPEQVEAKLAAHIKALERYIAVSQNKLNAAYQAYLKDN